MCFSSQHEEIPAHVVQHFKLVFESNISDFSMFLFDNLIENASTHDSFCKIKAIFLLDFLFFKFKEFRPLLLGRFQSILEYFTSSESDQRISILKSLHQKMSLWNDSFSKEFLSIRVCLASVETFLPAIVQEEEVNSKRLEIQLRETRKALDSLSERITLILDEMEDYFSILVPNDAESSLANTLGSLTRDEEYRDDFDEDTAPVASLPKPSMAAVKVLASQSFSIKVKTNMGKDLRTSDNAFVFECLEEKLKELRKVSRSLEEFASELESSNLLQIENSLDLLRRRIIRAIRQCNDLDIF
jgi:hypothetical protein